ncbi:2-C-methyl-D-erythritol 4-phosphate cytidylyltransferase [Bacilli bacterium PM5-3]|nr:2-C-methyl-D-erythritol 4-phosphate cytidylyltransferase [Bacilli bacterium PM5-3]MDH6604349.1 2-C-methyl-D-erythritol 4-phosphate cytidylyltransferase [Bacilli bacterium PM5-9]
MISLIILAAGQGSRMNLGYNKMFYKIDGLTVIEKCIKAFYNHHDINEIIVVINKDDEQQIKTILADYSLKFVYGGNERYDSVYNGLVNVSNEYVLIHDGARCFISEKQINDIIAGTKKYNAACLAIKAKDTIHLMDENGYICSTLNRDTTFLAQTPQGFKTNVIKDVYDKFQANKSALISITDDAMLVNSLSDHKVKIIESDYSNIKVTTIEDVRHD